jgi:hypothetical protein
MNALVRASSIQPMVYEARRNSIASAQLGWIARLHFAFVPYRMTNALKKLHGLVEVLRVCEAWAYLRKILVPANGARAVLPLPIRACAVSITKNLHTDPSPQFNNRVSDTY